MIAERQRKAWELHVVKKLAVEEIAQALGVTSRTVQRDLAAVRRRSRSLLRKAQRAEEGVLDAGLEAVAELTAVTQQAWAEFMEAPPGTHTRARFLNVVLKTIDEKIKILQSLGLMDKVPEEVLVGGIDLRRLSDGEAERALAFLRQISADVPAGTGGDTGGAEQPSAVDREQPLDSDKA